MTQKYTLHIGSRFTFTIQDDSVNLFSYHPEENHLVVIADIITQIESEVLVISPPFFKKVLHAYAERTDMDDSLKNNTYIQAADISELDISFEEFDIIFAVSNASFQQDLSVNSFHEYETPIVSVLEEESITSYNMYDTVYQLEGIDGNTKGDERRASLKHLKDIYVPLNETQLIKYELSVEIDTKDTIQ